MHDYHYHIHFAGLAGKEETDSQSVLITPHMSTNLLQFGSCLALTAADPKGATRRWEQPLSGL